MSALFTPQAGAAAEFTPGGIARAARRPPISNSAKIGYDVIAPGCRQRFEHRNRRTVATPDESVKSYD